MMLSPLLYYPFSVPSLQSTGGRGIDVASFVATDRQGVRANTWTASAASGYMRCNELGRQVYRLSPVGWSR